MSTCWNTEPAQACVIKSGATAIRFLVYLEHIDLDLVAEKMVERNADVNAISLLCEARVDFVGERIIYGSPLYWTVLQNHLDVGCVLLQLGADPLRNETIDKIAVLSTPVLKSFREGNENTSPIHLAAKLYRTKILEAMLEHAARRLGAVVESERWVYTTIRTNRPMIM